MAELPSKLFFRIGEVAELVGVEPHVLRYWEREFRSIRPTKSAKGQRVYSRKDVENLLRVRDLLYRDGYTIAGAKKQLHRPGALETAAREADAQGELEDSAPASHVEHAEHVEHVEAAASEVPRAPEGVRGKLVALRAEVEGFLEELAPESRG